MEETHQKIPSSGETSQDSGFEFESLTPTSSSQDPYTNNSPADHLFFNGRLLPHAFPASTIRTRSRTTSEDSSRSNSTSSRSSSSSPNSWTPRTSSCSSMSSLSVTSTEKSSERKVLSRGKVVNRSNNREAYLLQCKKRKATEIVMAQLYGSYSQRWQHITPVPGAAFKREGSVKRGVSGGRGVRVSRGRKAAVRGKKKAEEKRGNRVVRWWRRFIRTVVLACRECHAMEPESREDDVNVQRRSNCS